MFKKGPQPDEAAVKAAAFDLLMGQLAGDGGKPPELTAEEKLLALIDFAEGEGQFAKGDDGKVAYSQGEPAGGSAEGKPEAEGKAEQGNAEQGEQKTETIFDRLTKAMEQTSTTRDTKQALTPEKIAAMKPAEVAANMSDVFAAVAPKGNSDASNA